MHDSDGMYASIFKGKQGYGRGHVGNVVWVRVSHMPMYVCMCAADTNELFYDKLPKPKCVCVRVRVRLY